MIAIIYYAYGAPKSQDDIEVYFSHILNGKKVPEAMLENISKMFKQSGYPDFIRSSTERIAQGLNQILQEKHNEQVKVYPAYKHTAPFVSEVYEEALKNGAHTVVTLAVNPVLSTTGGGAIHTEVEKLTANSSIKHIAIKDLYVSEELIAVYADRVSRAYNWLTTKGRENAYVLFTVHSQPLDPERNEPYVEQFKQLASAIANKVGITRFETVYRSGKPAGWLAPDVKDIMKELKNNGATGFVTCELLSITADVESYIEVNVECKEVAKALGVDFANAEFLGDSFDTVAALAKVIEKYLC